jgi:hypothetical protein
LRLAALIVVFAFVMSTGVPARGDTADPASPPPSPAAKPTPPPLTFNLPVVFTFGLSPDATLNAKVAVALADHLRPNDDSDPAVKLMALKSAFVVPMGTWTLSDFENQCKWDPDHTIGAYILVPPALGSEDLNYLVWIRTNETIKFNAIIARCSRENTELSPPGLPKGSPGPVTVDWVSNTATGEFGRSALQFLPFAVLTSVYLAFAPSRTYATTTNRVYPVPSPLPHGGANNSQQTQESSTLNASGTGTLQNNVVNAVGLEQLAFGRRGTPDFLVMRAAEDAAGKLVIKRYQFCNTRPTSPPPAPSPASQLYPWRTDFCTW